MFAGMTGMNGLTHGSCGMSFVQLGILSSIFDWIYDHILSPVFDFLKSFLDVIFKMLFENLFLPLLEFRINITITIIKAMLESFVYDLLFRVARLLLWILDAVEKLFRTFAGLNPVFVQNDAGRYEESGSLLLTMLRSSLIQRAMAGMILASFALCFLIAIFSTIKAAGDLSGKQTVSKVMRQTGRALLRLILIPFMALVLVMTGDAVLSSIEIATNQSRASVSNILFTMSTLDAVREDSFEDAPYYNASTRPAAMKKRGAPSAETVADFGMTDKYRKPYYLGQKSRDDVAVVLKTFDVRRMDFLISIGLTVVFIFLFGMMAVNMVARIFDCLLLLLVEPFFAASIPLDEGEKFDKWQELFLGRLVSGYGGIVAMNLYLGVIGLLFAGKINFFGPATTLAVEYLVKILFAGIGAYTITKAGPVVTSIMSAQGGARETEVSARSEQLTAQAASFLMAPVKRVAGTAAQQGMAALKQGLSNFTGGGFGAGGGVSGGMAAAGTGAFGQMLGTGPAGVQFSGYRTADGMTVAVGGVGGAAAAGGIGAKFGGRRGADGRTIGGVRREEGPGAAGRSPDDRRVRQGIAAVAGGVSEDDFDTIFDVGGRSLFDEGEAGGFDPDDFDTVFDIGGGTLFDEPGSGAPTQAFTGSKAKMHHIDNRPGHAWRIKASAEPLGTVKEDSAAPSAMFDAEFLQPGGAMGADAPPAGGMPDTDFLRAGDAPGIPGSNEYTWIGQRDEQEREERRKYEEMLTAEADAAALDAAESSTGMDLNGDGRIEGGIFGAKDAIGASAEPLTLEDIVGASAEPIQRDDPLKSPDDDSLFAGSINDPDSED